LTLTVSNPNSTALTGIAFTDILPAGLIVSAPGVVITNCGGSATAVVGTNAISLTGGALAGGASCALAVNVAGIASGVQVNTTSTITATGGLVGGPATATILVLPTQPTDAYQVNYLPAAVGGGIAGGYIDISNDGALGADAFGPLSGTTGRICANVYVFAADEQESECCSCLVTPNALVHLTAADLIGNPGNGVTPTLGVVVKLLATIPGTSASAPGTSAGPFTGSSCNAATPFTAANLAPGLRAWATKFHTNATTSPATTSLTETPFSKEPLSPGELAKLTNLCQFLSGNQSGAGLCKACTLGGLGAGKR